MMMEEYERIRFHQTCRGNGDGMQAMGTSCNTGSPSGDRSRDQPVTGERWTGPCGVAERFAVPGKHWVVTNSTFSASARSLAQVNNIRLIDGHDLNDLTTVVTKIFAAGE